MQPPVWLLKNMYGTPDCSIRPLLPPEPPDDALFEGASVGAKKVVVGVGAGDVDTGDGGVDKTGGGGGEAVRGAGGESSMGDGDGSTGKVLGDCPTSCSERPWAPAAKALQAPSPTRATWPREGHVWPPNDLDFWLDFSLEPDI
jgi:hypothetical protein